MFTMLKRMLAVALVAASPTPAMVASPGARTAIPDKSEFIKQSVYEGLKEDGVAPKFAAQLADNPDFVPKCPLCWQTEEALRAYGKLEAAPAAKEGKGLPAALARG